MCDASDNKKVSEDKTLHVSVCVALSIIHLSIIYIVKFI